jgi:hypothetical protein
MFAFFCTKSQRTLPRVLENGTRWRPGGVEGRIWFGFSRSASRSGPFVSAGKPQTVNNHLVSRATAKFVVCFRSYPAWKYKWMLAGC